MIRPNAVATMTSADSLRFSPRLRDALISDLVMDDLTIYGDRWFEIKIREPQDWTGHLGRQLGIAVVDDDVHETLIWLMPLIDELLASWPPPADLGVYAELAHQAVKNLRPMQVYGMLLVGPGHWRKGSFEGVNGWGSLQQHLQRMLEKSLASQLAQVVGRWREQDIRKLREKRKEAIAAAVAAEESSGDQPPGDARRRVSLRELADYPRERPYVPPGRT